MLQENKKSFFIIKIKKLMYNELQDYEDQFFIDLVQAANGKRDWYQFTSDSDIVVFLTTHMRTRPTALISKITASIIVEDYDYSESQNLFQCEGLSRDIYYTQLSAYRSNTRYRLTREPMIDSYSAEDLKVFEDYNNFHHWQKTLYEKIIAPDGEFNAADARKIMSIVDKEGKKGKSSFVKWLCYNYPLDIARISYGTASQLRSAVFNMGRRKCYIIDKQLMMAPPTVIVFSNIRLPYNSLSEDRWDLYTINPDLKLVKSQHLYFGGEDFYQEDQLKETQVVSKTRSKRTRAKPKKEKA